MDEGSQTVLHTAVEHGHKSVVDVLLRHGASPTILRGRTLPPIHLACAQSKTDIVIDMVKVCGTEILDSCDSCGATPLHYCTKSVCDELFSFVTERSSSLDCQDDSGTTPLHSAAIQGIAWRVELLLSKGADPMILNKQGYNPFHLSLIHHREEVFQVLAKSEYASVLSVTPDTHGNYPIHLAVEHKASHFLPTLLSLMNACECSKLLEFKDAQGDNVLHAAAKHGSIGSLEYLLSLPCSRYLLNSLNTRGLTPLHYAASSGSSQSVRELLSHGAIAHKSHGGATPLMLACLHGHLEAALLLLEDSPLDKNIVDEEENNALHMAAKSKNIDVILMCLDSGIAVTLNSSNQTFFDIILREESMELTVAVLKHDRWEECLNTSSPDLPHPLLRIIKTIPEAFQVVLDRSVTRSTHSTENPDYWEEYNFKYLMLDYSQQRSTSTAPVSLTSKEDSTKSLNLLPKYDEQNEYTSRVLPNGQPSSRRRPAHHFAVISVLIKFKYQKYLLHPLIATFLDLKWRRYARFYYSIRFLLFFLFVNFLSVFILVTPPPQQFPAVSNVTTLEDFEGFGTPSIVLRFLTIAFALPNLMVWLFDLYILGLASLKHFFSELELWIHGLTLLLTLIFTVPWEGLSVVHWEVGALTVFLAWIRVALALQPFAIVGLLVTMMISVTKNVFGVLFISSFIICSFAFPLYILLATVPNFTYSNFGTTLFSVLASLHAELDYRNFVLLQLMSELGYPVLTFMFLCLAAIIMPIVVINLLIGLAVGDIVRIQHEAVLSQRGIEVNALKALDKRLPKSLRKRYFQEVYRHYPNKSLLDKLGKVVRGLWSEFDEPTANPEREVEHRDRSVEHLKSLAEMKECMNQIELAQTHQQESLKKINDTLLKILASQEQSGK